MYFSIKKERLKVEIFYTFNRKSKQKYLALSLSNTKNGCYIFMFYYVDPHLYKTKYATTSNTRAGLPGRISVDTILFFPFIMKALHAGTQASLKPVLFTTPLLSLSPGVHRFQAGLQ